MVNSDAGGHAEVEVALTGGNMSAVARRGDAVHRTAGPWTPTIHRLLEHLHQQGITWLPRPLGLDELGREVLTFLPGNVPTYPLPPHVWTRDVLETSGRWLARVHSASRTFDTIGATWQLRAREPFDVICLGDVAPYNTVFDDSGLMTGWIDVDVASPGPRVWDLAHLAYRLVPLSSAPDTGAGEPDLNRCRHRLAMLCAAYAGAGDRIRIDPGEVVEAAASRVEDLAAFTAARAAAGAVHVAHHVDLYHRDVSWITAHRRDLTVPSGLGDN